MDEQDLELRVTWLRETVLRTLGRRGAVVQTSGGIDSAVTLHLCVRAFGAAEVCSLFLPDAATGPDTLGYAEEVAAAAGVDLTVRSIAASIEAQQPAVEIATVVRSYFPDYDPATDAYSVDTSAALTRRLGTQVYQLSVGPRHGEPTASRTLRAHDLRRVIAYQNRKQRTRMTFAYAEAEAHDLAVVGASNGDELRTGFVVKYGDDAADVCAIGDLAKSEVYELARLLGVPESVQQRPPTTDTFALVQGQDDYYYALPAPAIATLLDAGDTEAEVEAAVAAVAAEHPGWEPAALRNLRGGFAAAVRHNTTRSTLYADPRSTR